MKEDLVLLEAFTFIWIKVVKYTIVKWDHLVLLLIEYLHENQQVFLITWIILI